MHHRVFTGILHAGAVVAAFVATAFVFGAAPRAHAGGTIIGVVTTKQAAGPSIRTTIDPSVCGATVPDESVVVDGAGHLANAVVTVSGVKSAAPAEAVMTNETCRFVPRVALLKPGGAIKMSSKDATLHTMHASMTADGKDLFNVALPVPNLLVSRPLDNSGVVKLACNTHTWMRGWVVVTDELSAMSAVNGAFRLENVPAGVHELRVWHEALTGAAQTVTVKDGQVATVSFLLAK